MNDNDTERIILPTALPLNIFLDDDDELVRFSELSADYTGIAASFSEDCRINAIVLATSDSVLILSATLPRAASEEGIYSLLNGILCREKPVLVGFDMAHLLLCIHRDIHIHVQGIDLSITFMDSASLSSSPHRIAQLNLNHPLAKLAEPLDPRVASPLLSTPELATAASFIALQCARVIDQEDRTPYRVRTMHLSDLELDCLGTMQLQFDRLETIRPFNSTNDFEAVELVGSNQIQIQNARYNTKIRKSRDVLVTYEDGKTATGRSTFVKGKETTVRIKDGGVADLTLAVKSIQIQGLDGPSTVEAAQKSWLIALLHNDDHFQDSSEIIRSIWFPTDTDKEHMRYERTQAASNEWLVESNKQLNNSQAIVAGTMICSGRHPLVVTHGPPGTGKTMTICAAVKFWAGKKEADGKEEADGNEETDREEEADRKKETVWLIAQSNIGVKNIAESLVRNGIHNFKLIVSSEFFDEWHEHIYEGVQDKIIKSKDLPKDFTEMKQKFQQYPVILCTMSMLSNPTLVSKRLFEVNPVQNLVVDEASQIYVGSYLHIFHRFRTTLKKVCWFGDPRQLPPFGKDSIGLLSSVFEVPHLSENSLFLDTSYRLPRPLGRFLSEEMYDRMLLCKHKIASTKCVAFVDVDVGEEEAVGTSWKNTKEAQTIVHLVKHYYKGTDFVVITPYDAQRAEIAHSLSSANEEWEGKVFNVDSFQGNEAQYVLISVTRTHHPGFLVSDHRVNVMLSRCKGGMVIVTRKSFLRSKAQSTLIGRLAKRWEDDADHPWSNWRFVLEGIVDMPGVKAPNKKTHSDVSESRGPTQEGVTRRSYRNNTQSSSIGRIDSSGIRWY